MEARPSRMFEVLRDCGALARLLPEVDRLWGVPQRADHHPEIDTGVHLMMVLDVARRAGGAARGALSPASVTIWARARRRPTCCRVTSATKSAACGWCAHCRERLRVPTALPRAGRAGRARARQHPPQRRIRRCRAAAADRALRRTAPAAALRRHPVRLRMRCARPARSPRRALSAARRGCSMRSTCASTVDARGAGRRTPSPPVTAGPAIGEAIAAGAGGRDRGRPRRR